MSLHKYIFVFCFLLLTSIIVSAQNNNQVIRSKTVWNDDKGSHINAHGGGVLFHQGRYYWYGEHRLPKGDAPSGGVSCYSSADLCNWVNEGIVLATTNEAGHDLERGCIIERPKVIFNPITGQFVMWFHLELKGQGYAAARAGVAVSDSPTGNFQFLRSGRINAGVYPANMTQEERAFIFDNDKYKEWWTAEWYRAIDKGLFVKRDLESGQMSRDMTLYVDEDGKAYHIYSSEDNLTLHIAELTDDYLHHTGNYIRLFPGGHNEAPAIFKKEDTYWMIASGCTGWQPNEARLFSSPTMWGPWTQHANPCIGTDAAITFGGQSTFALPVEGANQLVIFMADVWNPDNLIDSRYVWLPVEFQSDGTPTIAWSEQWSPLDFVVQPEPLFSLFEE